ncbi:Predicted membrane protein, putative toxin regulator [Fusobacterium necrophorum subsp. necrophorum]|nr:Predicted membrane protein, putative toxin regulator [Fusobacterium necrophorum subsp. necrophorum]
MKYLGEIINKATELHPVMMGITLAVSMGMILTLPISSAAIGISLGLHGLAAGAALGRLLLSDDRLCNHFLS